MLRLTFASVLVVGLSVPAARADDVPALEGSFVSVRLVGGLSPYLTASWEVLWRSKVAVAGHYRGLVNYDEGLHAMKLVPTRDYAGLLDRLESLGLFDLKPAPEPVSAVGGLAYEIEARRGDRRISVSVTGPDGQADPRYAALIAAVRDFVVDRAGDLAFRNVFFEPGTFGYLNLTAVPVCRVRIDGRDLSMETPVYGYELPAGDHEVHLVAVEEGWERTHTLRVQPGMTTIVHFDLR